MLALQWWSDLQEQYALLKLIWSNKEEAAVILTLLFTTARAVVALTPSTKDDAALEKAWKYVQTLFSLLRVKGPSVTVTKS